jgi:RNA polymerase sigma-54 factor
MKQSLQLKLGQHLTMTPQLQQAIRLLQLSTLELQTEIQEALETNPMLEVVEEDNTDTVSERREDSSGERTGSASDDMELAEGADRATDNQEQNIPKDLPTDSDWEDTFDTYSTDKAIATTIIDAVNDDGYLSTSLEEIHQSLSEAEELELDEIEAVLFRVQDFDPPGVAARDLQECMSIQLRYYDEETSWLNEARQIVNDHFDLLAKREYQTLMRRMKLTENEMQKVVQLIQGLNPRPGGHITGDQPEYIIPDVFVKKIKGKWRVDLNPDITPNIGINSLYAKLAHRNTTKDAAFLKNNLQEARWFIKSLKSRNETLLKVSSSIVARQRGFFEYGEEAMKPMVMHDIAEAVEMHESTISRVTTKKYMHTPRGIFELKFFFSSHVSTATGGECSATAIRAILKKLIAAEIPNKPLSDNKLATMLAEQGINVARRTVAKYREAMSISPSNERKRLV